MFFYNKTLALWITLPTLIGVFSLLFGIKNNKGFFSIFIGVIITLAVLAYPGKIVFITKYATLYLKSIFNRVDVLKGSDTSEFRKILEIQHMDEKKDRKYHSHRQHQGRAELFP